MDYAASSMTQLAAGVRKREASAESLVRAALDRLGAAAGLNAFVDTFPDHALERAREIDRDLAAGNNRGPLAGVPFVVKDNMCVAESDGRGSGPGGRTTCASRILEGFRSPYTATAVQKLLDAGGVLIAKTNLDEFAMGSSGESSCFGPTKNPWDHARVPGGSSSGSAAAVAAGVVPMALGSDTGGSIRQPASWCNLVGVKPTYGRVSRYGLIAYASSLDQIGPISRTVTDAAATLAVISGCDNNDSTSGKFPHADFLRDLDTPIDGLRIGVPRQARSDSNHPGVAGAFEAAVATLKSLGATIVDADLPHTDYGVAAYYLIAPAEASSNLARFDGVRYGRRASLSPSEALDDLYIRSRSEGFGPEVQRRIMLGTYALSSGYYDAYYATAAKVRRLIQTDYETALLTNPGCHALLMPVAPSPAFKIGAKDADPLSLYLEDVYTVGVNLAGIPAVSIPAGFANVDGKDLPVGVQLIGSPLGEPTLLRIARAFERETTFGERRP